MRLRHHIAFQARVDLGPHRSMQEQVDRLESEPSLVGYHLLPTVRGDLLAKLGRAGEARIEFERATAML